MRCILFFNSCMHHQFIITSIANLTLQLRPVWHSVLLDKYPPSMIKFEFYHEVVGTTTEQTLLKLIEEAGHVLFIPCLSSPWLFMFVF